MQQVHDEIAFNFGQQSTTQAAQAAGVRLRVDVNHSHNATNWLGLWEGRLAQEDIFFKSVVRNKKIKLTTQTR